MKDNPSQLELFQAHPRKNPRIERVSRTRKVIYANFSANRTEVDFCNRFKAKSLSEAVQNPDAAIDFLCGIESFVSSDKAYLTPPILIAVGCGRGTGLIFVENLSRFAEVMRKGDLMGALTTALRSDEQAADYFSKHKKDFGAVSYLGKDDLSRALAIAQEKLKA